MLTQLVIAQRKGNLITNSEGLKIPTKVPLKRGPVAVKREVN